MDLNYPQHSVMQQKSALKISPDGYIRLSFSAFSSLPFVHLITERDASLQEELVEQAIPSDSAGFSECISSTEPIISVGWAWYLHSDSKNLLLVAEPVRSNVMIVDMHGYDVGSATTSDLISEWLHHCDWQSMVRLALRIPVIMGRDRGWINPSPC